MAERQHSHLSCKRKCWLRPRVWHLNRLRVRDPRPWQRNAKHRPRQTLLRGLGMNTCSSHKHSVRLLQVRRSLWARHVYHTWLAPLNSYRFVLTSLTLRKKKIPKLPTPRSHKSRSLDRLMYYHVSHPGSSCNGPADLRSAPIQTLQWDPSPSSRQSREPEHGLEIGKKWVTHTFCTLGRVPKLFTGWVRVREIEVCGGRQKGFRQQGQVMKPCPKIKKRRIPWFSTIENGEAIANNWLCQNKNCPSKGAQRWGIRSTQWLVSAAVIW